MNTTYIDIIEQVNVFLHTCIVAVNEVEKIDIDKVSDVDQLTYSITKTVNFGAFPRRHPIYFLFFLKLFS